MKIGRFISAIIENGFRFVTFYGTSRSDVLKKIQYTPFGFDSVPTKDTPLVFDESGIRGKGGVLGYAKVVDELNEGDSAMYATDAEGNIVGKLIMLNDGTFKIGGDADNMVRYTPLKSGFDGLRTDLNALVTKHNQLVIEVNVFIGLYNAHTPTPATLATLSTAVGTPSTATIANSKINEIKTL